MLGGEIGTRAAWAVALSMSADTTTVGRAETQIPALVDFRPDVVVVDTAVLPAEVVALTEVLKSHSAWSVVLAPFDINTVAGQAVCLLERRQLGPVFLPRFSPYVVNVMERFARLYQTSPSVDSLAGIAGVSRSHLTHGFRAETGLAVMEYLVAMRVRIAKELLRETQLKLEHVAHLLGFCDASHFSRVFRAYTGRRPGHYRRAFRLGRAGEEAPDAGERLIRRAGFLDVCG